MANLSITSLCNRRCSYCFARPERPPAARHMSPATFRKALDFLARSGVDQVRLLGGEPTLHPRIEEFLGEIRSRGLTAVVFSNGLIPERVLKYADDHPEGKVTFLINATAGEDGAAEVRRRRSVLKRLGGRAMLGVNITSPAVDLPVYLDWIGEFGLSPLLRLGLAHPSQEGGNLSLHPNRYASVGRRLRPFRESARRHGVLLRYDCGFVPCMFGPSGPDELADLFGEVQFGCGPIPDILPDGSLAPCYPLAGRFREDAALLEADAAAVKARFSARLKPFRGAVVYRECADCPLRRAGRCPGGCLSAGLGRLRKARRTSRGCAERSVSL